MIERRKESGTSLDALPLEILAQIVTYIETARTVSDLSSTCKKIFAFVEKDGFRVFTQTRFPYAKFPDTRDVTFWKDATRGLVTQSRNWDRKALIARRVGTGQAMNDGIRGQREVRQTVNRGQTMGYIPVIDSYEAWYGGAWASRKEVVAWGAGAAMHMRIKYLGKSRRYSQGTSDARLTGRIDVHQHEYQHMKYHEAGALEGRDDITSVNLLSQQGSSQSESVVIGRANGGLTRVVLSMESLQGQVLSTYATQGRPVRSATMSQDTQPLLAACLSDSTVALYDPLAELSQILPIAESSTTSRGRTWSLCFLNKHQLAVGFGVAKSPIRVYNVGCGELIEDRVLSFGSNDQHPSFQSDRGSTSASCGTSVYAITPVSTSALAGGMDGNVFLGGSYDGLVRLHDLRSPMTAVAHFQDPVDTLSPIYSLLAISSERFVAGGGRHSILKVFDLRSTGGRMYHVIGENSGFTERQNISNQSSSQSQRPEHIQVPKSMKACRGWNIFLDMGSKLQRNRDSPTYSLSRPSQVSPSLYAGIESMIIQIDMVSIMDRHCDPIFDMSSSVKAKTSNAQHRYGDDVQRRWDPQGDAASLPMYEHDDGPVNLLKQRRVGCVEGVVEGWDERWSYHRSYR